MIPAEIETIVLRCLEKVPEKRFQTVDDVCAALETVPQEQDSADIASLVQATIQQIRETSAYDASWTEVGMDSRTASYSPAAAAPPSIWNTPEGGAITQVLPTPTIYGPADSPTPRLYLLTLAGAQAAKQSYALRQEVTTIGRSSDNDVVLRDNKVSRYHARITAKGGAYYVEDLNTANGVQVNDALIAAPVPLGDRDTIRIGQSVLEYRAVPNSQAYGEATTGIDAGTTLPPGPLPTPPAPA
jgi:hypothetical protein